MNNEVIIEEIIRNIDDKDYSYARYFISELDAEYGTPLYTAKMYLENATDEELEEIKEKCLIK